MKMRIAVKKNDLMQKCKDIICDINRVREIKTKKLHKDFVLKHYKNKCKNKVNRFWFIFRKQPQPFYEQPTEKQLDDMKWLKDTANKIIDRDFNELQYIPELFSYYCDKTLELVQELLNAAELHTGGDLLEIDSKEAEIFQYNFHFER